MRLYNIVEDESERVDRQARQALRGVLGRIIEDPDGLYDHLIKGTKKRKLLLQDKKWWETLFNLLQPLDTNQLYRYYKNTMEYIIDILKKNEDQNSQTFEEGMLNDFVSLFKKVATFIMKTIIDLIRNSSGGYGGGRGGYGGRNGRRRPQNNQNVNDKQQNPNFIIKTMSLNVFTICNFMEQVIKLAEQHHDKSFLKLADPNDL